jgi:hypothetical protein
MSWVAPLEHPNYSTYIPVHLQDLAVLEERFPELYTQFIEGMFVGHKTDRKFSCLPLDQMHEQLNDYLKNDSGVIGNLDDPRTVRREQVARPEMLRIISELEGPKDDDSEMHHEQYSKFQGTFQVI